MTKRLSVLVADDEWLEVEAICHLLRDDPRVVVIGTATNGEEAVALVGRLAPDLVLMDIRMPGSGGLEATRLIRRQWPRTRVVMVTAFSEFAYAREALRQGALAYLLKPVTSADLGEVVSGVLSSLREQAELQSRLAEQALRTVLKDRVSFPAESERMLTHAVKGGNVAAAAGLASELLAAIAGSGLSQVQTTLAELLFVLVRAVNAAEVDPDRVRLLRVHWAEQTAGLADPAEGRNLAEAMGAEFTHSVEEGWVSGTGRLVARARAYIDAHFHRDISLESVAAHTGVHPSYLSRIFSRETGHSFVDYLTERRLAESLQLLLNPDLTIDQVAERVGFRSAGYFSTVFRKRYGQTPSEMRRHRNE